MNTIPWEEVLFWIIGGGVFIGLWRYVRALFSPRTDGGCGCGGCGQGAAPHSSTVSGNQPLCFVPPAPTHGTDKSDKSSRSESANE